MRSDAASVFTNTDEFAESVTYYAGGTGSGRVIKAVIERDVQVITDQSIPALATFVTVVNSSTLGISSTEIDTGRDKLGFEIRLGDTSAQTRQIVEVSDADDGMVRFEVN